MSPAQGVGGVVSLHVHAFTRDAQGEHYADVAADAGGVFWCAYSRTAPDGRGFYETPFYADFTDYETAMQAARDEAARCGLCPHKDVNRD